MVFHDYVGIRKALRAVSRMLDGRPGGRRRGRPRYSNNAGSAGIVDGTGYPTSSFTVGCVFIGDRSPDEFGETILNTRGYCNLYSRPSQLFIRSGRGDIARVGCRCTWYVEDR
jgi:hypothetical protein